MTHILSPETAKLDGQMRGVLDPDVGIQDFEIGRRMREDNGRSAGHRRFNGLRNNDCEMRMGGGLKLHFWHGIRFDKMLQGRRLARVLGGGRLFAGMLTATVRGCVGEETEQDLRARETVTPEQSSQQQDSQK